MPLTPKECLKKARAARFTNELDIIAAIDKKQALVKELRFKALTNDGRATEIFYAISDWHDSEAKEKETNQAKEFRRKATAMRSRAEKIETQYLSRLKGRLAVFRTDQLPALDNKDRSVPK